MQMAAEPEQNRKLAAELVREAAGRCAKVICLPELYHVPYFCRTQEPALFDLAEDADGPSVFAMRSLAAHLKVVIVVPFFERRAPGLFYNSAVVIGDDGSLLGLYRKMHIPQDPGFEEKFYFTPGDLGFKVFKTRHATIGLCICWDQWFPEAARLTALAGAQVIFYPTAIGWQPSEKAALGEAQHGAWETVQRGHAVANGCFVAAVNRVGVEDGDDANEPTEFWGQSFIADCYGQLMERASVDEPCVRVVECDLEQIEQFRRIWPFYRDRRIDAYGNLTRRTVD